MAGRMAWMVGLGREVAGGLHGDRWWFQWQPFSPGDRVAGTAASESVGGLQRDRWRLQWLCSPGAQVAGMAALKPQGDLRRPRWWFQWQPCSPGARVIGGTGIDE